MFGFRVLAVAFIVGGVAASSVVADTTVTLTARNQSAVQDTSGGTVWQAREQGLSWPASRTALVLCDVWDKHPGNVAPDNIANLADRINEAAAAARTLGIAVIHAPTGTMDFYRDHPARLAAIATPEAPMPAAADHKDPPFPIDDSGMQEAVAERVWTQQHPAMEIAAGDYITDNAREMHNIFVERGIRHVLIAGMHTSLVRNTVKQWVRWGYDVALVRDLTNVMNDPLRPPYVNPQEGTELVVEYVEKFWCPTVQSDDLGHSLRIASVPAATATSSVKTGSTQWQSLIDGGKVVSNPTAAATVTASGQPLTPEAWAWRSKFAPYNVLDPASQL
ncbi:MAG: hypothetical protein AMXMBFR84_45630 [Candidatus Hydrogenedentota bacterium]